MYPPARPTSRPSSAAVPTPTNPTRTNNPRDRDRPRSSIDTDMSGRDGGDGEDEEAQARVVRTVNKINQVIQQFFLKGALTIVSSRVMLPQTFTDRGEVKQNKWFNVLIGDADVLVKDMTEWRLADVVSYKPPVLIIEIYIDLADLTRNQTLVILDDDGKRWDVDEALNSPSQLASRSRGKKVSRVVLERWTVQVGPRPANLDDEESLSHVYKKAVVLIRSLFTFARLLPTQKYWRRIQKQPADRPSLKPKYRIINGDNEDRSNDTLNLPLHPSDHSVVEKYRFHPSPSPVGPLCIAVEYRTNCEFRVDNAESLLSSRFMGLEDDLDFKPSLPSAGRRSQGVPGSMPTNRNYSREKPDLGEAYGSMSTFHQVGNQAGTSPISALRAARDLPSSPTESPPQRMPPNHRLATGSKSSLRSEDGPQRRRPSVSFQPFKAGSLSSSPAPVAVPPSPTTSSVGGRPSVPTHTRNRSSQYALPQQALRTPSTLPNETAVASSASSSPKPAPISRYTSSFSNRKSRFSLSSRPEDDNTASDKGSISSARPGSATNDNEGGSSGSFHTDEDEISDLLKLIESKKELKSLNQADSTRASAMLSKYRTMKDSNAATAAMSDSFSSSLMLHRSSSSSSRQLSSVPPMVAGTSVSTSSSPGKPISPHTPHTPAIPSRLSANSIIDYGEPRRSRSRGIDRPHRNIPSSSGGDSSDAPSTAHGETAPNLAGATTAIDIPTSPRPWPFVRRSSSVSQQARVPIAGTGTDDDDLYGLRSASLPADERPDLSLSELLTLHHARTIGTTSRSAGGGIESSEQPSEAEGEGDESAKQSTTSSRPESREEPQQVSLVARSSNRSPTTVTSPTNGTAAPISRGASSTSLRSRGSRGRFGSGSGGRFSLTRPPQITNDDDEPLLFAMSDFGVGRRSLEEGRGGSSAGERGSGGGRRGGSPFRGV